MKPKKRWMLGAVGASFAMTVFAAPFQNGSFETSTGAAPGMFTNLPAGDTSITGWTVIGTGGVDYIGTYWNAQDGERSLDISGNGGSGSGIEQSFDTVVGMTYRVTLWLAGNPDCGPGVKRLDIGTEPDGGTDYFTWDMSGQTRPDIRWEDRSYMFTATSTTTTLRFSTPDGTACGPALDNVSVQAQAQAVPSPVPALSPLGLMALGLGFGAVAVFRRRYLS